MLSLQWNGLADCGGVAGEKVQNDGGDNGEGEVRGDRERERIIRTCSVRNAGRVCFVRDAGRVRDPKSCCFAISAIKGSIWVAYDPLFGSQLDQLDPGFAPIAQHFLKSFSQKKIIDFFRIEKCKGNSQTHFFSSR